MNENNIFENNSQNEGNAVPPQPPKTQPTAPYGDRPTETQPIYASSHPNYSGTNDNIYGNTTPKQSDETSTGEFQKPQTVGPTYHTAQGNTSQTNPYQTTPSSQWQGYQSTQPAYHVPTGATPPQQPKKKSKAPFVVALLLACAVISAGCGIGGAMLANNLNGGTADAGTTVVTQSLVNSSNENTDVAAVAASTMNSVVEITTEVMSTNTFMQQYVSEGAGSGVIISADGYIVTNNHVIADASSITVTTKLGDVYQATLVGTDADSDLAVLKIDATDLNAAVYGDSDSLVVGESAIAIGNPLGSLGGTVTAGIISALDREITIDDQTLHLLQTNAAINPGNSGGGLFNAQGELIGIVNAKSSGSGIEGLGFAIPINTAKEVITDLIEHGYVTGRVQLGVSLLAISDEQTAMMYRVSDLGVYIAQVSANSDAYYGGLQVGDLVKSVNGTNIETVTDVKDIISNSSVGDVLSFVIVRNNQQKTVDITLTEYNANLSAFNS